MMLCGLCNLREAEWRSTTCAPCQRALDGTFTLDPEEHNYDGDGTCGCRLCGAPSTAHLTFTPESAEDTP